MTQHGHRCGQIRIVDRVPGNTWKGQVGFSEIELFLER